MCTSACDLHTYDDQPFVGPSEGNVDLILVCDEAQVLLTPALCRVPLYLALRQRAYCAEDYIIPFTA